MARNCSVMTASAQSSIIMGLSRLNSFRSQARVVIQKSSRLVSQSDEALEQHARELRWRLQSCDEPVSEALEVYALVRELVRRDYGMNAHAVQVMGALAMLAGGIAEMQTGEGKTLTALFPAVLRALAGRGCHVLTVNDYLAERDADFARPLMSRFGLSVAALTNVVERPDRFHCYEADVTYGTEKEFGFDFLKDQLVRSSNPGVLRAGVPVDGTGPLWGVVQRDPYFALIDEADSLLIDQARTPLIIALPQPRSAEEEALFTWCQRVGRGLREGSDYEFEHKSRSARLMHSGCRKVALAARPQAMKHLRIDALYYQVERALVARDGFDVDRDFLIVDGKVEIIDEGTGRVMPGRKWRDGLQQAIEIEAGVEFSETTGTAARISLQNYLSSYPHLCGMTGTAARVRLELMRDYGTPVTTIPTHRRCLRRGEPTRIYRTLNAKMQAVADEVRSCVAAGRAVLVGTSSVAASEQCAQALRTQGIEVTILHARHHEQEAEIVQQAGQPGRVTVATNMAGRGTDIKIADSVRIAGGLHVICTEMNRSARIDRQLIGRTARQGDPGSYRIYVSLEDSLLEILGLSRVQQLQRRASLAKRDALSARWLRLFQRAQRTFERMDAKARRRMILEDRKRMKSLRDFGFDPTIDFLQDAAG